MQYVSKLSVVLWFDLWFPVFLLVLYLLNRQKKKNKEKVQNFFFKKGHVRLAVQFIRCVVNYKIGRILELHTRAVSEGIWGVTSLINSRKWQKK